ncbi:hypothetical protein RIF29_42155 [Crotalaria pallida]|uniref:Uncharacterized protein n=1 Tax=Crotalaria pallida TaxID=3830 RepID=A0AAN9HQ21_CROPI
MLFLSNFISDVWFIVEVDLKTEAGLSMESATVSVTTAIMPFIEDHMYLNIDGKEYEIFVKERDDTRDCCRKKNDKVAKELTYEDNSDDAQSNDEEEARLTWEIGKMLGLKAANEEQVKKSLLTLRRSNRKRTNKGVEGCH